MEEQQDKLAAAINYFHGQAEISDFAAEVEGYLKELHALKSGDKKPLKVFKMSALGYYGSAFIAAETEEQAKEVMSQYKGFLSDNRILEEFPKLSANVNHPQVILNALHVRIGSDATQ